LSTSRRNEGDDRECRAGNEIPGVDLDKLSPAAKAAALKQLGADTCTCGCGLTLAACRINDPAATSACRSHRR
jgi:hypothetical protein